MMNDADFLTSLQLVATQYSAGDDAYGSTNVETPFLGASSTKISNCILAENQSFSMFNVVSNIEAEDDNTNDPAYISDLILRSPIDTIEISDDLTTW